MMLWLSKFFALKIDPYRALFPLGALLAVLGVVPWLLLWGGSLNFYPSVMHSHIMLLGFIMSFVIGFLMTAIPRMTSSTPASIAEIAFAISILTLQSTLSMCSFNFAAGLFAVSEFLFILTFIFRRFRQSKSPFSGNFVFLPLGVFCGLIGSILLFFLEPDGKPLNQLGRLLFFEGMILNLIVGLGSRLIPVITRKAGALSPKSTSTTPVLHFMIEAIILNASFLIEAFLNKQAGILMRFLILSIVLFKNFKIHSKSLEPSLLGKCIEITTVFFVLPFGLCFFWPQYEIHFLHILFITGFALLTFLISIRVTVSHGGESLDFEKHSWQIPIFTILLMTTMLIRVLGPIIYPQYSIYFIGFGSVAWIGSISFWAFHFIPRMFRRVF